MASKHYEEYQDLQERKIMISFLGNMLDKIEHNRLWLAGAVILIILLLGIGWFVRMDTGHRWPLFVLIALCVPVVPWLLKVAYKTAAPLPKEQHPDAHSSF